MFHFCCFGPSYPPIRDLSISVEGVKKLLKGVNPRKAAGPDQVPCRLLQALHEELAQVFTLLFQKTYEEGSLPDVWKTAWITPIYKKDAKCLAANYRPVSLTCVSCKLFQHILASHIRNHLDEYGILYPGQHGFRKKLSCESQLLVTTHDFLCRLDSRCNHVLSAIVTIIIYIYSLFGILSFIYVLPGIGFPLTSVFYKCSTCISYVFEYP